ncbi:efflux RND transporter periplasmic adaptor subunit (plasmid) [Brucella anthropi]|uniref:Secretion protein HlyD family protein n=1 Tax=Brucella anthropi (strain ATCC 49188 / DSM 6882 / CCUG 24695 / JCM 21032 / LMG 3331 / NBRC 15819 / NCTC 12168 / Alc 37) TaxID=439375 RepID=A6X841_BRUA4|nr:HlyD family secretion protein [Brucella anthropi]ABS17395.1 secretion protein HlyD family protein [Brucella anthropi ATCC 49188]QQC28791.1 efflux RND transporter periplasmic adaptor subunit [Brucella anthropi]SUB56176.1 Macrolide-specific efflux protein macA precursor [Brucella anthropi]
MSARKAVAVAAILAAGVGAYVAWSVERPRTLLVQGEVEATRIDLATKVAGRVSSAPVSFGDRVTAGQLLVELDSPQLKAGLDTAEASLAVARSNRELTFSTRPETIAARRAELSKAEADVVLAQRTYDRLSGLLDRSVTSQQAVDQASNSLDAALRAREAAEANLQLAENGNSVEQKAVAVAQVRQAEASVAQTTADIAELTIRSPIDGQVTARMAEPGKLFSAGAPVISIVDVDRAWFTFNVREDLLDGLEIGRTLQVRVPALGNRLVEAKITAINALGSFANWRATKATGDFDLRTFELRAEPVAAERNLRPGMSALVEWSASHRLER